MVINIASFGGRTHMLDTARELEKFGHKVRFYSYVPTQRALKFGLKKECSYSLFIFALPFLVLFKLIGFKSWLQFMYQVTFDWFLSFYMKPCDVFIGQSPMHKRSLRVAQEKYNAITILERGTSHVLEYINNLSDSPEYNNKKVKSSISIQRDISAYEIADFISVGAQHVKESFLKHGFPPSRIFVNNYGCNLSFFHPTELNCNSDIYDIIQVGNWSYRKGADLIEKLCTNYSLRFLHVGSLSIPFPQKANMTHVDAVQEYELVKFYSKAKVFIMPSREEGLAQVQVQALVCGLPIVCSKHSGGIDLKKYVDDKRGIIEMDNYDLESLVRSLKIGLEFANNQKGIRLYCNMDKIREASWEGYGKRYNDFLNQIISAHK